MEKNIYSFELEARVLGNFDVIVCGGGTSGVIAALASARNGARTLLIEKSYFLGGMITMGNTPLSSFVPGANDPNEQAKIDEELKTNPQNIQIVGGIALEIANDMIKNGHAIGTHGTAGNYVYTDSHAFKIYLYEALKLAGIKIMLHSKVLSVLMDGTRISGVVFDTKEGPLAAYGKYIIDATGDADISYLSGADCLVGSSEYDEDIKCGIPKKITLSPVGTTFRIGGVDYNRFFEWFEKNPEYFEVHSSAMMDMKSFFESYKNGDSISATIKLKDGSKFDIFTYPLEGILLGNSAVPTENLNGVNADDLTQAEYEVLLKESNNIETLKKNLPGFENAFIADVPQAGIRETRHVIGEYRLSENDVLSNKSFDDTVGFCGYTSYKLHKSSHNKRNLFNIPYKCLIAKGIDNLLLCGRLISVDHSAYEYIQSSSFSMVTGEVVGTAAAILSSDNIKAKDICIKDLRNILKNNGVKC